MACCWRTYEINVDAIAITEAIPSALYKFALIRCSSETLQRELAEWPPGTHNNTRRAFRSILMQNK